MGVITRGCHVPFLREVVKLLTQVHVVATNFNASSIGVSDLNNQVTCPCPISIKIGVGQINTKTGEDAVKFNLIRGSCTVAIQGSGIINGGNGLIFDRFILVVQEKSKMWMILSSADQ